MTGATTQFSAGPYRCFELGTEDIPGLQGFFEANPEYFLAVCGERPKPLEAQEAFDSRPPAGWPFARKWLLGFDDGEGSMIATADVTAGLFAESVWHIALFIVATPFHGRGVAQSLYGALESWMRGRGARWLRLGVVAGNARAERFWEKAGYREIRTRSGIEMGRRVNTLRVMVKPLADSPLQDYLAMVPRDRPGA